VNNDNEVSLGAFMPQPLSHDDVNLIDDISRQLPLFIPDIDDSSNSHVYDTDDDNYGDRVIVIDL